MVIVAIIRVIRYKYPTVPDTVPATHNLQNMSNLF